MRRILFIGHAVELAGAEIALVRFISALDRTRYAPTLMLPRQGDLHALIGDIPEVRVFYEPALEIRWDDPRLLRQIGPIFEAISAHRPDLVVVQTNAVPQAIIATLLTDIPLLVHLQAFIVKEQFEAQPDGARFADLLWLPFADHLVACSTWLGIRYGSLLGRTIASIPNPVGRVQSSAYPAAGTPAVVMLASLEDNKRPDLLIRAAAQIKRKFPRLAFRCDIFGEGTETYTAYLYGLIRRLHLGDIVFIYRRAADTTPIYQNCALVFVGSVYESFSNVCVEAAAHRRPVVSTRCGGPESIVVDCETGFLIEIDSDDAAADRIAALLLNPERAAEMGEKARTHFERSFAPERTTRLYEDALETAIQDAPKYVDRRRLAKPLARYFMNKAAVNVLP